LVIDTVLKRRDGMEADTAVQRLALKMRRFSLKSPKIGVVFRRFQAVFSSNSILLK